MTLNWIFNKVTLFYMSDLVKIQATESEYMSLHYHSGSLKYVEHSICDNLKKV